MPAIPFRVDAAVFPVAPGPGGSAVNLRQAINQANASPGPDVLVLEAGTYVIEDSLSDDNGVGGDLDINDDLTIQGAGSATTVIDGLGLARVFDVNGVHEVAILDVTIQNGDDNSGGCIDGGSSSLALTRVVVRGGHADQNGGGISMSGGTLAVIDSMILSSTALRGGGIHALDSAVELTGSTVGDNHVSSGTSAQGGGIYFRDGTGSVALKVTDSIVRDNSASDDGGGIENYEGRVEILRSTIRDNSSGDDGGGIENDNHNDGGFLSVTDSAFIGNSAVNGGGIDNDGEATLTGSTISGNTANSTDRQGWGSGGIRSSEDTGSGLTLVIESCTLYGNQSWMGGAGLEAGDIGNVSTRATRIEIRNSIVGRCFTDLSPASPGAMLSLGNNLFEDDSGANKTPQAGAAADLVANPQLGLLSDDGTAGNAHLPLLSASPAIDAGDTASAPAADQLGEDRVDGDEDGTVIPDIGSVESPGIRYATWFESHFNAQERADPAVSGSGQDPDGDGRINADEYAADTDPLSAASFFRALLAVETGGSVAVEVNDSSPGRLYTLEASGDLGRTDGWQVLAGPVPGTGANLLLGDPAEVPGRKFYRARVEVP
ncbi:choice-of-anchor Q domain-containing protein [Luteolibacter marinus]|uniref:choice-of-anchor Q domain-containing protein n=1 Tax=Luteolibacter marinus TaxID=2776705 RepID=UPI001867D1A2|nr:choice-of-anchor Q domain-containing protein [Luteolibacter marinus]